MQKKNDIIEHGVQKILDMACNDPDRKVKASTIVREMTSRIVAMSKGARANAPLVKQSMTKAANLYNAPDRAKWVTERMERYNDQMQFVGLISIWYDMIMSFLSPLQAKILDCILQHYHRGASGKEIARLCFMETNTTTSTLSRMVKAELVQARNHDKDRRQTVYYVPDVNWLRVHALRNVSFRKWLECEPETTSMEDVVDRFITWFTETEYDTEGNNG